MIRRTEGKKSSDVAGAGDWLLLQQEFGGLHSPVGVKPALHNVVAQKVCQSEQAHALMVHHPRSDKFTTGPWKRVRELV